jgi:translation initiation factor IF-2
LAAKKIRVFELARELGMTNKEVLELSENLGVGVKSHSSGMIEAQADRVRRKAEREGLTRDEQPEEPVKKAPAKAAAKKAPAKTQAAGAKPMRATGKATTEDAKPMRATGRAMEAPDESAEVKPASPPVPTPDPVAPFDSGPKTAPAGAASPGTKPRPKMPPPPPGSRRTVSSRDRARAMHVEAQSVSAATPDTTKPPQPRSADRPMRATGKVVAPPAGHQLAREAQAKEAEAQAARDAEARDAQARVDAEAAQAEQAAAAAAPEAPAAETPPEAPVVETAAPEAAAPVVEAATGSESTDVVTEAVAAGESGDTVAESTTTEGTADAAADAPAESAAAGPTSASGKAIPPPPGPPTSSSGKVIPPPPGMGGRMPAPTRAGRPGAGPRAGRPAGGPAGRPGGGGGGPMPPGGGFPPRPGGGPPGRGRPGGGPGGPPRRRKSRRRRNRDELQPMDAPSYTPDDAAVPEGVIVVERLSPPQDLGPKLNRTAADVVRFLMQQGEMVTATQSLTDDMIELFAAEIGAEVRLVDPGEEQEVELVRQLDVPEDERDYDDLPERPPVITVMGHVDHGKTKLLDRIRNANVVAGEAGGITQHIGAYQAVHDGRVLTFLDTPGHEAFTTMRMRGADATDVVVLVVAADDGVMPQTIEAIAHARAAEVPIVVAVNKIDREAADPNRVLQQLSEHGLVPEAWGGDTVCVEVSALQGLGIDDLLEHLLVVADVEDLRATPEGRATGVVLEANLDVGRGPVATVLVQRGTLKVGDPMVAGPAFGKVRALINDQGEQVTEAGPSSPVQVLGLSDVAQSGDNFVVAPDERKAKAVGATRERWQREIQRSRDASALAGGAKLEDIFKEIQAGETATLNVIVKADVHGSLEAVTESLQKLERDEVKVAVLLRSVGGITKSDVQLAGASNALILGFNVRPDRKIREMADEAGVEIRTYEIIYKLLEDIEAAMVGMLAPEFEEVVTGDAEVREVFRVPKAGMVAGCQVLNGAIKRGSLVRFLREGTIIWTGEISSLRRFKEDVREVASGFECGIGLSDFQDLKNGDIIETYELREIPRT